MSAGACQQKLYLHNQIRVDDFLPLVAPPLLTKIHIRFLYSVFMISKINSCDSFKLSKSIQFRVSIDVFIFLNPFDFMSL